MYNLTQNPFGEDWWHELDCPTEKEYYATIDGFGESKEKIEKWVTIKNNMAQFVLIDGPEGSGRTSVANYISGAIAEPCDDIIRVSIKIRDEYLMSWIHEWMQSLVDRLELDYPVVYEKIEEYAKKLGDEPHINAVIYKGLVERVARQLPAKNWAMIAVFEEVIDMEFVDKLTEVFKVSEKTEGTEMV